MCACPNFDFPLSLVACFTCGKHRDRKKGLCAKRDTLISQRSFQTTSAIIDENGHCFNSAMGIPFSSDPATGVSFLRFGKVYQK
jgi:hypothetical protein